MGTKQELLKDIERNQKRMNEILEKNPELDRQKGETLEDHVYRLHSLKVTPVIIRTMILQKHDENPGSADKYHQIYTKMKSNPDYKYKEKNASVDPESFPEIMKDMLKRNPELRRQEGETLEQHVYRMHTSKVKPVPVRILILQNDDEDPGTANKYYQIYTKMKSNPNYKYKAKSDVAKVRTASEMIKENQELAKREDETFVDFIFRIFKSVKLEGERNNLISEFDPDEGRKGSIGAYKAIYYKRVSNPKYELKKEITKTVDQLLTEKPNLAKMPSETFTAFVYRIFKSVKKTQERTLIIEKFDEDKGASGNYSRYASIYNKRNIDSSYEYVRNNSSKRSANEEMNVSYGANGVIDADLKIQLLESEDTMEVVYKKLGINQNLFNIVKIQQSRWDAQTPDGMKEMVAVKVKLEPLATVDLNYEKICEMIAGIKPFKYKSSILNKAELKTKKDEDIMVEIPLLDLHFNKLAEMSISGASYSSEEAARRFNAIVDQTIEQFPYAGKYIMPIGQDFFNIDTYAGTTTAGTPQDTHQSLESMFQFALQTTISNTDKLLATGAKVEIPYTPGNHGKLLAYMLTVVLKAYYRSEKKVLIDDSPRKRKYIRWGTNLIGLSHGDKEAKTLPFLMQQEAADDWAATTHREWHLGHLHHLSTKEQGGMIFRRLSAATSTDRFHYESGYVGSQEGSQVFEWHKKDGLKNIKYITF